MSATITSVSLAVRVPPDVIEVPEITIETSPEPPEVVPAASATKKA
jgi:hypothetical protein